jgi:hypothetical protein
LRLFLEQYVSDAHIAIPLAETLTKSTQAGERARTPIYTGKLLIAGALDCEGCGSTVSLGGAQLGSLGDTMGRVLKEILLLSCMVAFATGVVLAAASLLG